MRTVGTLVFAGIVLMAGGCADIPKYDLSPAIEFAGIDQFDSEDALGNPVKLVRITLAFEDGDGDLGEDPQSEERRNFLEANGGWGNYRVEVLRLQNEKWERHPMPLLDSIPLMFPFLKTDGSRGPIRGKLDFDIDFPPGTGSKITPLKFIVKIRDRELRESNIVETDSILVPVFDDL